MDTKNAPSKYKSRKLWLTLCIALFGAGLAVVFLVVGKYDLALAAYLALTGAGSIYTGAQAWQNRADATRGYLPGDGPSGGA